MSDMSKIASGLGGGSTVMGRNRSMPCSPCNTSSSPSSVRNFTLYSPGSSVAVPLNSPSASTGSSSGTSTRSISRTPSHAHSMWCPSSSFPQKVEPSSDTLMLPSGPSLSWGTVTRKVMSLCDRRLQAACPQTFATVLSWDPTPAASPPGSPAPTLWKELQIPVGSLALGSLPWCPAPPSPPSSSEGRSSAGAADLESSSPDDSSMVPPGTSSGGGVSSGGASPSGSCSLPPRRRRRGGGGPARQAPPLAEGCWRRRPCLRPRRQWHTRGPPGRPTSSRCCSPSP
mmetsp:Transcript_13515/g.34001  ORF Transcript_13515/g.34001 Transcript_13515/m.34001 type:complete len:285 (+) Transcript_13515:785-1639(+)